MSRVTYFVFAPRFQYVGAAHLMLPFTSFPFDSVGDGADAWRTVAYPENPMLAMFVFTETKKQSPNTGARASNTLHK